MENNTKNKSSSVSNGSTGAIAIIVVGIFVLCVIVLLAKGIFASNSSKVPDGLDTATINTDSSGQKDSAAEASVSSADSAAVTTVPADESSSAFSSDTSSQSEPLGVMYVTEYSYLHVAPDKDAENIVCMSPGVEVQVLGYEDNGYVKITFQNIDGPLTGYLYKDYLTSYNSQETTYAEQGTAAAATVTEEEQYSQYNQYTQQYTQGYENNQNAY